MSHLPKKDDFRWTCPSCRRRLTDKEEDFVCESESLHFSSLQGIPDLILPSRRPVIDEFLKSYQKIRRSEQWGSDSVEYYLRLPYEDMGGQHRPVWKVRLKTYECFLKDFREYAGKRSLTVADLGAGSCWLSHRLAKEDHDVLAVDINTDGYDGLGALSRYSSLKNVRPVRAEFDFLPFPFSSCDVIVFNSSLHYSKVPAELITRTLPFLKNDGIVYVLDSPIYDRPGSGKIMLKRRIDSFRKNYGIDLPPEYSGSYLTYDDMENLSAVHELTILRPKYGIGWHSRRLLSRILGRKPAQFMILRVKDRK